MKESIADRAIRTHDGDKITYAEFSVWKSKPIVDDIDRALARHYGFTDEELDFTPSTVLRAGINYDIKSRMGGEAEGEEG